MSDHPQDIPQGASEAPAKWDFWNTAAGQAWEANTLMLKDVASGKADVAEYGMLAFDVGMGAIAATALAPEALAVSAVGLAASSVGLDLTMAGTAGIFAGFAVGDFNKPQGQ
jgi:hypothetical protein